MSRGLSLTQTVVTDAATQSAVLLLAAAGACTTTGVWCTPAACDMRAGRTASVELLRMRCCGSVNAGLRTQCAEAQKSVLRPTRAPRGGRGMRRRRGEGRGGEQRLRTALQARLAAPPQKERLNLEESNEESTGFGAAPVSE